MADADLAASDARRGRAGEPPQERRHSPKRERLITAGVALLVLLIAYLSISWVFTSRLIAVQFPADPEVAFADFGLPQPEDITVASGDTDLSGWYFDNPADAGCGVVMLHGYAGNRGGVVSPSPLFWDRGCDLLFYDLRGHGQSSAGDHTYGVLDRDDQNAAIDWFIGRTGLPENKVGLIGWSYGAATSILTAAERPGLAFVIADASYSSLWDIASVQAEALFGTWAKAFVPGALFIARFRGDFDPGEAAPGEAIKNVTIPTLLVQSTTDDFTPYEQTDEIYANSNQDHTVYVLTTYGALHASSYGGNPAAYTEFVDQFLDTLVPGFGTPRPPAEPDA